MPLSSSSGNRRRFLKHGAGLAAFASPNAAAAPAEEPRRIKGIVKGLTLLTIRRDGRDRLGVKTAAGILDVTEAARLLRMPAPATLDDLLQNQDGPALNALVAAASGSGKTKPLWMKEDQIEFGPLVSRPDKIICVGLNYRAHVQESGRELPKQPVLFNKFNNSLHPHGSSLPLPSRFATKFDYEVELVLFMGREAKNVSEAGALDYVAGYATGNDLSARDLQLETGGQWMIGKTPDHFAPIGPYFVSADRIDPDNLAIECRVNGETRQSSNTSRMIFNCRTLISYMSRYITLKPGDVIFTGTPEGVIQGMPKDKQVWLKAGDRIQCSVEKLGELRFTLA
jgi:2-keto-4-pentenoate hydratase/2-oxohepta-3-ene-1,7-dioic acid hydratase in catechol pathway